jgi:hypothetical protein
VTKWVVKEARGVLGQVILEPGEEVDEYHLLGKGLIICPQQPSQGQLWKAEQLAGLVGVEHIPQIDGKVSLEPINVRVTTVENPGVGCDLIEHGQLGPQGEVVHQVVLGTHWRFL